MAHSTAALSPRPLRAPSLSPGPGPSSRVPLQPSSPRVRATATSSAIAHTHAHPHAPTHHRRHSSIDPDTDDIKENVEPREMENLHRDRSDRASSIVSSKSNGLVDATANGVTSDKDLGNGGGRAWRDGSVEVDDDTIDGVRRRNPPRGSRAAAKSPPPSSNGLPTLATIPARAELSPDTCAVEDGYHPHPPPAPSAGVGSDPTRVVTRKRRSSSIKIKPAPGVTPTKAVDWEIPRKSFHSSIGFLTLLLNHLDPPTLAPLITILAATLVIVFFTDLIRLRVPAVAEIWEQWVGFLMRDSERTKINGVVWYLVGVIFVLALYPRDVAVVAILTLSWSDTTASTIGRLWGKYTPPLPPHFPGVKLLPFAPRKSLAGFLAASVTGFLIGVGFWWHGSANRWAIVEQGGSIGLILTAAVVGIGGAVVEALDLGVDDNLTLPILSGAVVWLWLATTNLLL